LDKQFKYAEKKGIPYVIVIGSRELEQGAAVVKNLNTGQQITVPFNYIFSHLQNN
jgi:histidyl-tRNA synthetase